LMRALPGFSSLVRMQSCQANPLLKP
jgi:hypothetical protein